MYLTTGNIVLLFFFPWFQSIQQEHILFKHIKQMYVYIYFTAKTYVSYCLSFLYLSNQKTQNIEHNYITLVVLHICLFNNIKI